MVLRWSQILVVAYFTNIVCCGFIVKSSKDNTMNIFKMSEMNEISRTAATCPDGNSDVPVFLVHSDDCSKFYVCDNGTPYLKTCHQGLHFNPRINSCDYPKNVGCDKKTTAAKGNGRIAEEKKDICPPENSELPVHLAHPDDCQKFYVCDNGTPYLKSCQPGLHFNPRVNACDYAKNAGCDKKQGINEKSRIVESLFDSCPLENSEEPVFFAHDSDCGKFYICDNGEAQLKSCPAGLHFNSRINACDYPQKAGCDKTLQGVAVRDAEEQRDDLLESCPFETDGRPLFIPHSTECDKFFICKGGKKFPFTCPSGLYFNYKQGVCDFPENTDCEKMKFMRAGVSSPFCPPMDGKSPVFFRHTSDCNVYYMCGNGLAFQFTCPARLHFNLRKKVCDYEVNAKCKVASL